MRKKEEGTKSKRERKKENKEPTASFLWPPLYSFLLPLKISSTWNHLAFPHPSEIAFNPLLSLYSSSQFLLLFSFLHTPFFPLIFPSSLSEVLSTFPFVHSVALTLCLPVHSLALVSSASRLTLQSARGATAATHNSFMSRHCRHRGEREASEGTESK